MTTRQRQRLQLAEAVCRLVMRDFTTMFYEKGRFCFEPEVLKGLLDQQARVEKEFKKLYPDEPYDESCSFIPKFVKQLRAAIFAWMRSVGLDPASQSIREVVTNGEEMARAALGDDVELHCEFGTDNINVAEAVAIKTPDQRAKELVSEYGSGAWKGLPELELLIAAEILAAEAAARKPYLDAMRPFIDNCDQTHEDKEGKIDEAVLSVMWERMMRLSVPFFAVEDRETGRGPTSKGAA